MEDKAWVLQHSNRIISHREPLHDRGRGAFVSNLVTVLVEPLEDPLHVELLQPLLGQVPVLVPPGRGFRRRGGEGKGGGA